MIGSLFSGVGGLELGLESCGLGPVVWQAENNGYARAVLARHWPEVHRYNDVREIDHEAPPADIICGGFPCQDISNAGGRAGIDGAKSGLWAEYARIVRVLRPAVVFVENVGALVVRGLDRVLGDLAALGYDAEWETFLASDVGAPHRRERLFLLAYADRERVRQFAERDQRGGRGQRAAERGDAEPVHDREELANANVEARRRATRDAVDGDGSEAVQSREAQSRRRGGAVADAPGARRHDAEDTRAGGGDAGAGSEAARRRTARGVQLEREGRGHVADANGGGREGERRSGLLDSERTAPGDDAYGRHRPHRFPPGPSAIAGWDGPEPAIRRSDAGLPGQLDGRGTGFGPGSQGVGGGRDRANRLRCLGNAVVPQQAALAWRTLSARVLTEASL